MYDFATPLGGRTAARLEFPRGVARLTLAVDPAMADDLCRAQFEGRPPTVTAEGGTVTVDYRGWWLFAGRRAATITLNGAVAWEIAIRRGASRVAGDLRALRSLRSLEVRGGVSRMELALPRPEGVVPLEIRGGASGLTVARPAGVPATLDVAGGLSRLELDDQRWGSMGGPIRMTSPGGTGEDRYEIRIGGGASSLAVSAY